MQVATSLGKSSVRETLFVFSSFVEVYVLPQRIMLTLFLEAGGGKLGDSSSISLVFLLEVFFSLRSFLGVTTISYFLGSSSFSPSLLPLFLNTARKSYVECPFRLWKKQNLLALKVD